jgi:hypothetical protein
MCEYQQALNLSIGDNWNTECCQTGRLFSFQATVTGYRFVEQAEDSEKSQLARGLKAKKFSMRPAPFA